MNLDLELLPETKIVRNNFSFHSDSVGIIRLEIFKTNIVNVEYARLFCFGFDFKKFHFYKISIKGWTTDFIGWAKKLVQEAERKENG